jgi:hypothetical protein
LARWWEQRRATGWGERCKLHAACCGVLRRAAACWGVLHWLGEGPFPHLIKHGIKVSVGIGELRHVRQLRRRRGAVGWDGVEGVGWGGLILRAAREPKGHERA